jgi:hypothetical protein
LKIDIKGETLTKKSPFLFGGDSIYQVTSSEVEFVLNCRRLFDFGCGRRFDEHVVKKLKFEVGLQIHTEQVVLCDDAVTENFFRLARAQGNEYLFAVPTGYDHHNDNQSSMEKLIFEPPLIGKIESMFSSFGKVRGSQIGLYSNSLYLFAPSLDCAMLDVDGKYSLFMGSHEFILGVVGENSWDALREPRFSRDIYMDLVLARDLYGYS